MAVLTVAQAITAIRTSSNHDDDDQTDTAQITAKLDLLYKQLLRRLKAFVPNLFESVTTPTIASSASPQFAKPANTESVQKVERLISGTQYDAIEAGDPLNYRNTSVLNWYEQAGNIIISPAELAVGGYRVTALLGVVAGYTSLTLVPEGMEDILIEQCAAFVRQRHDESPAVHMEEATRIWKEQIPPLIRRHGAHPRPGLSRLRVR